MSRGSEKKISLALQGGGAHGAFTWGVLDRLLEDGRIAVEAISGTSAGAMNAVVAAHGLEQGGRQGAREALEGFWRAVSLRGSFSPYHTGPFNPWGADWSPAALWFDVLSLMVSPYQLNPFNLNPLRQVLADAVDFERLRRCRKVQLYICATNVRTNHLHVFETAEISLESVLASACLPQLHHAVEVDGEFYWDGGFMGNPVLEPLVRRCQTSDIVIVQLNPTNRAQVPTTAFEIADRLNEITFNASLMHEMRAIARITRMIEKGILKDPRYELAYLHLIEAGEALAGLGVRSKLDTSWAFLTRLRDRGREGAERWLGENFAHLGRRSTLDLAAWEPLERCATAPARAAPGASAAEAGEDRP
jgi:NTE family protein